MTEGAGGGKIDNFRPSPTKPRFSPENSQCPNALHYFAPPFTISRRPSLFRAALRYSAPAFTNPRPPSLIRAALHSFAPLFSVARSPFERPPVYAIVSRSSGLVTAIAGRFITWV